MLYAGGLQSFGECAPPLALHHALHKTPCTPQGLHEALLGPAALAGARQPPQGATLVHAQPGKCRASLHNKEKERHGHEIGDELAARTNMGRTR